MKKTLAMLLCLLLLLLSLGCGRDDSGALSSTIPPVTKTPDTTSASATTLAKYEQPPVMPPLENDKYPNVSHITIYKNSGMRYDITDRKEIEKICDYYKDIKGSFEETRDSLFDLLISNGEHVDREIRFFFGGYAEQKRLGTLCLTTAGRYAFENGGDFDIYQPSESDFEAYKNYFDEIFSSQDQPYMDVYTR